MLFTGKSTNDGLDNLEPYPLDAMTSPDQELRRKNDHTHFVHGLRMSMEDHSI